MSVLGDRDPTVTDYQFVLRWLEHKCSLHGFNRMSRTETLFARKFWACLCLIALAVLVFSMLNIVSDYISFETVESSKKSQKGSLRYPHVTVCNHNSLYTDALQGNPQFDGFCDYNFDYDSSERDYIVKNLTDDELRQYGPPFSDFIFSCFVGGYNCSSPEYWTSIVPDSYRWGACWTLDTTYVSRDHGISGASYVGLVNSVDLVLNVNESNYCASTSASVGARMMLHDQTTYPNPDTGLSLAPGFSWSIGMSRTSTLELGN